MRTCLAALLATTLTVQTALADCATDAMIVFDGSGSMGELGLWPDDPPRIVEARDAMRRALPQVEGTRRIGLLTYGPGSENVCGGIETRFGPIPDAARPVMDVLEALEPYGLTPLARSVESAAETLAYRTRPAIVVVVTDGNDTCAGRPCELAGRLAAEGLDLTVHVLGFKVVGDIASGHTVLARPFPRGEVQARCLADETGGTYALPETVAELVAVLQEVLGCAVTGTRRLPDAWPDAWPDIARPGAALAGG